MTMSRRELVQAAGATLAGLGIPVAQAAADQQSAPASKPASQPTEFKPNVNRPIVISSANGIVSVARAVEQMRAGKDPLDAVVAGINIVEDDPKDHSVGYGGLPNEDGVVELDSSVMDGRTHKAGAVASLQRIKNPSSVALLVMRRTDHVLLVGEGALKFARAHGFQEQELLTEESRRIWLKWKEAHSDTDNWLPPETDAASQPAGAAATPRRWEKPADGGEIEYTTGTITCIALTPKNDVVGCTSTSGLSWKIAGRVGDSPIIGAGLYVDNEVGGCGSTGRGEANLQNLSSFFVVERMRAGLTPTEAAIEALQRVVKHNEKRLRDKNGNPNFGLTIYALRKDGLVGGAALTPGVKMSYHDGVQARHVELPGLLSG